MKLIDDISGSDHYFHRLSGHVSLFLTLDPMTVFDSLPQLALFFLTMYVNDTALSIFITL